jgi:serine O-acetyltransferase
MVTPPILNHKHTTSPSVFAPAALLRKARRQKNVAAPGSARSIRRRFVFREASSRFSSENGRIHPGHHRISLARDRRRLVQVTGVSKDNLAQAQEQRRESGYRQRVRRPAVAEAIMGLALPAKNHSLWSTIQQQAAAVAAAEPVLAAWMREAILNHGDLAGALAQLIAVAVGGNSDERAVTRRLAERCYRDDPSLIETATLDLMAPLERDPACPGALHVLLHFKGYIALQAYRISHRLWERGRTEMARELHGRITQALHVSIHPSVMIGSGLFIDHGTGVTVGEGVVIGDDGSMLQEVTIGRSPEGEAGAPRIGRGVLLSAGAIVLGNVEIGDFAKVGAGSLVLASVPSGYTAVGVPARLVSRAPDPRAALNMDQSLP